MKWSFFLIFVLTLSFHIEAIAEDKLPDDVNPKEIKRVWIDLADKISKLNNSLGSNNQLQKPKLGKVMERTKMLNAWVANGICKGFQKTATQDENPTYELVCGNVSNLRSERTAKIVRYSDGQPVFVTTFDGQERDFSGNPIALGTGHAPAN